jgi:general secretion pathway protein I
MKFQNRNTAIGADLRDSAMNKKMLPGNQNQITTQGFTLIEVMIAMAIFAIGILAVTSMQMRSINQNASARMQTEATALAVEGLERLKMLSYDHTDLDEGNNPHQDQFGSYTIQWEVTEALDLPTKTITVTVINANPNAKDVRLSTIKAQGS